ISGKVVENINIKLPPFTSGYEVSGRVIDEATGQPISKIRVNCLGGNKSGRSHIGSPLVNERGEFSFNNLAPGNYAVFIPMDSLIEYYSDQLDFELVDQDISGLEIKARRAASLSGEIVIKSAIDPAILSDLSHMGISVSRTGGGGFSVGVQTNARGQFRIPGLPPDKYGFSIYSKTGRQSFWLLDVERDGVSQIAGFEVTAGEQMKGFRVFVAYGEGVLHGRVQVVGGSLPEDLRFDVSANRADIPGKPASASTVSVDAQGRFILKGLATGDHEITLTPFIPSPNGRLRSGRWSEMKQTISVKDRTESQVTFVFNVNPSNKKERKQ
ncbi:MAG: carboxypeptidase-like regulatory domain-containing protein, partial [Acidobacteria bacterium]|nr:carboxypeptidase-like regulatory domain-containing protein [Acidobacteriota bacterium]